MKDIPYTSTVENLMYAQVCTHLDVAYVIGKLDRYLCNPGIDHWKAAKKVIWYLQRTNDYMFTYNNWLDTQIQILLDISTSGNPLQVMPSWLQEERFL